VGGRPLLERQLEYLAREGVRRVVINVHHHYESVVAFAAAYSGPVTIVVSVEVDLLGTAGGVRNALDDLGDDPFVVLYGDVVVDAPLAPVLAEHRAAGAVATLTVYEAVELEGKGTVETATDGRILRFREKSSEVRPPALVNAGLYVVEPALLAHWARGDAFDFGHDVFPRALQRGQRLQASRLPGSVIDIGTPAGLAEARAREAEWSP
ncbi:MAG: NDP-sugar synthase, partial [Chloroflexota bacterium]|nr:NDP-sugar synthase [Chloroflexota bacterium]